MDSLEYGDHLRSIYLSLKGREVKLAEIEGALSELSAWQTSVVVAAIADRTWQLYQELRRRRPWVDEFKGFPYTPQAEFERNLGDLVEQGWRWLQTGQPADPWVIEVGRFGDRFWSQHELYTVFYQWIETFPDASRVVVDAGASTMAEFMRSVPRAISDGRDRWHAQTFGEDLAFRAEAAEVALVKWTSPQKLVAYDWVLRDIRFLADTDQPPDLDALREHTKREVEAAIRWDDELVEVELPLDGPLGDEPVWPLEVSERIRREAEELESTFPH